MRMLAALLLAASSLAAQPLPGTGPLTATSDLASDMVAGIDRYLTREWAAPRAQAPPDRARFRSIIGLADPRLPFDSPTLIATLAQPSLIARTPAYEVHAVKWPVFAGVDAEGYLLKPLQPATRNVVAIPDADQTPESLIDGPAGRLAASGCQVLIPTIIDRKDTWSANPARNKFTNQPHREFLYRMTFILGRHVIGYEVQKVLAAVDWFAISAPRTPISVYGYGEGGLLALYSAAADERIESAAVSGYFRNRRRLWEEPIYRNVWNLIPEFDDAQLARLIAPRRLIVEAARHPEIAGPPPERSGRRGAAPGRITTPPIEEVRAEVRAASASGASVTLVETPGDETLRALLHRPPAPNAAPAISAGNSEARQERQFRQFVEFTQALVRTSDDRRRQFQTDPAHIGNNDWYRNYFWEERMGKLPASTLPLRANTRQIYDTIAFKGYEVTIPLYQDVDAYGVLLVPKNIKPGERRPVVVAQHGLEGRPQALVEPDSPSSQLAYQRYAARLAERGFIVYAPQNPYIFGDRFRVLNRKGNPLKKTIYSFIIRQHERTLDWLETLPFVDGKRMAFYGLSYGGKTAMRIPAVLPKYAVTICSGDFNEWIWKIARADAAMSYLYTGEYEILEWSLADSFNYAEMASLIAPRPFMVERGHHDGVSIDEWVSYEYAKVRRHYSGLQLPANTAIEYFNGPHQIWGSGTFEFLHRHLRWP